MIEFTANINMQISQRAPQNNINKTKLVLTSKAKENNGKIN